MNHREEGTAVQPWHGFTAGIAKEMRPMTPEECEAHTAFLVKRSRPIRKVYDLGGTHQGVNKQGE